MTLNAVLSREIKERMRSARATVMMVIFIGILSGILYLAFLAGGDMLRNQGFGGAGASSSAALGRMMFEWLLLFLLIFVVFMAPGIAAGGIVGERERRTLHLLQVTMLSPRSIVLGKIAAALAYLGLLVLATAPLFTIPLVLGGVTPWQVVKGFIVIATVMIFLASLSTYVSTVARRLQFATVMAYGTALFLMVGTLIMFVIEGLGTSQFSGGIPSRPMSPYLNPVAAISSAVTERPTSVDLPVPLTALGGAILEMERRPLWATGDERALFVDDETGLAEVPIVSEEVVLERGTEVVFGPDEANVIRVPPGARGPVLPAPVRRDPLFSQDPFRRQAPILPLWTVHVLLLLAFSVVSILLAAHRLRTPAPKFVTARRDKSGW